MAWLTLEATPVPRLQAALPASSWLAWRSVWPCRRARSATRWARTALGDRCIRTSLLGDAKWCSRRIQRWRLGSGAGRKGLLARPRGPRQQQSPDLLLALFDEAGSKKSDRNAKILQCNRNSTGPTNLRRSRNKCLLTRGKVIFEPCTEST